MALPTSGAISLSNVNTELGYSSTATVSLNDSALRNLTPNATYADAQNGTGINTTSSTIIAMYELYGASSVILVTVTEGNNTSGSVYLEGYSDSTVSGASFGSRSPTTITIGGSSRTVQGIYAKYDIDDYSDPPNVYYIVTQIYVILSGTVSKTAYTSITIDGTTYNTADSAHSTPGSYTSWVWTASVAPGNLDTTFNP
jgi:hypothetical protein